MKNWFRKNKKFGFLLVIVVSVLLLIVFLFDFSTILTGNETRRGYQELENTAKNHSHIIENRIGQYFLVLEKDALLLKDEELTFEKIQELLGQMKQLSHTKFDSMGIADKTGRALFSTGESTLLKDKKYFEHVMSGEKYAALEMKGKTPVAVVCVPIFDSQKTVKGVLIGKEPLEEMGLLDHFSHEESKGYVQLEDQENDIIWNISGRKKLEQIVVKVPISHSNWYLYEGTNKEYINQTVRYYQKDMFYLTMKILILTAVMCGLYISHMVKERRKIENLYSKLCLSEEVYRLIAEHSNQCIFTFDAFACEIHFLNEKYKEFGFGDQCINVATLLEKFEKESVSNYQKLEKLVSSVKDHVPKIEKELLVKLDGKNRCLKIMVVNLFDEKKLLSRSLGMIEDITEQKENAMMMKREQNFRKSILADCLGYVELNVREDMVIENSFDAGNMQKMQGSFTKLIEFYAERKVLPEYRKMVLRQMSGQMIMDNFKKGIYEFVIEYQTVESDGNIYWTACEIRTKQEEEKKELTAYLLYRNIDEKKKEQLKLQAEASRDPLTGAFKRNAAFEQINHIVQKPLAEDRCHVFMLLDVDNFKTLNDTLGHIMGDQALINIVKTAKLNCRVSDLVCRLGGDEFIIFLPNVARDGVEKKVETLLKALRFSYEKDGSVVSTSVSMGVALAPKHGNCFDELYAVADQALYKAKTNQKGTYCLSQE